MTEEESLKESFIKFYMDRVISGAIMAIEDNNLGYVDLVNGLKEMSEFLLSDETRISSSLTEFRGIE